MSKRINVMLSDEMNDKLDCYSQRYGISKSSIVGFVVGQWIDSMEKLNNTVYGATGNDGVLGKMLQTMIIDDKNKEI